MVAAALEVLGVVLAAAGAALTWGWPAALVVIGVWLAASAASR